VRHRPISHVIEPVAKAAAADVRADDIDEMSS